MNIILGSHAALMVGALLLSLIHDIKNAKAKA